MKRLCIGLAVMAVPATAHEVTTESLVIDHPYALETPATAMSGAGYMTITNSGSEPDRLLAVRADFPRVTLHGTETDAEGVTRMVPVEGITIAPGETVTLAPGGMHVMFMGLDGDPFEEGERIPATLVFERAGEIAVEFWIEPRTGATTGHEGYDQDALAPAPDPTQTDAVRAALRDLLGPEAAFGPLAIAGDAAVATWQAGGEAGRALLRAEAKGWRVVALSGESLRLAATFRVLGLSPHRAAELERAVTVAEADLDASERSAVDGFVGTVLLANE
ncbi:copper uptake system-associated protein [Paracoccus bogoriensis]|uniref:copper uptake system-associated protein n=1 Tax=Paracoccus bogoriensis TaxID=242065 RepID=UPI001CA5CF86|nr:copper uptake system-associated protein [Paracoccus bogoriensis]MBW7057706.1 copper uptake system-associated protein [Paracoccus bogoriensis]